MLCLYGLNSGRNNYYQQIQNTGPGDTLVIMVLIAYYLASWDTRHCIEISTAQENYKTSVIKQMVLSSYLRGFKLFLVRYFLFLI